MRSVMAMALTGLLTTMAFAQDRAAPIPPPPADRSSLPAVREGIIPVRVQPDGRLSVALGGWGGQRLILAGSEPETFRKQVQALKGRGLNLVRPLFHPPNAAGKNDGEWARFDWAAMDAVVRITQEEGVYLLVDYHNWLVNDTIHVDEATWLKNWGWIADRYKSYPHLIFEGFNEAQNHCPCQGEHFQKWVDLVRSKGATQLLVVSPFWAPYFKITDPRNNWAQCRHFYMRADNGPTIEKAQAEADWHLIHADNPDSAVNVRKRLGCGFFMTEGGIEDGKLEDPARIAGVQRIVENCEKAGIGWSLWAQGDWAKEFDTFGSKLRTTIDYPSITGEPIRPPQP